MSGELGTTNLLLGIMAAASVLEALVIIGMGVAGFMAYRNVLVLVDGIERRQVAPAMAHVNAILDEVKTVTATVREETERVDHAIHTTMDRIDNTADRVRSNVRARDQCGGRVRPQPARRNGMDAAVAASGARHVNLEEAT
jgi:hypothetical protein